MSSASAPAFTLADAAVMIKTLRDSGLWDAAVQQAEKLELQAIVNTSGGSMSDSSKRRASPPPEFADEAEDDEFEHIAADEIQVPIPPRAAQVKTSQGYTLPEGIESVVQWGKTICTLPKMQDKKMTYEALVRESRTDEDIKSYLNWVMTSKMKSAKVDDFKKYLQAIQFNAAGKTQITYPGTGMVREFGS